MSVNVRICGLIGIVAIVIYLTVLMVLGFVEPGYSHIRQFPSELGGTMAQNAWVMNANFHIVGVMIWIFAYGLHKGLPEGKTGFWGPLMLALLALSMFTSGFFQCAEGCLPTTEGSKMHGLAGLPGLIGSVMAPILIYRRLKTSNGSWPTFYTTFSLVAIIIQVVGLISIPLLMNSGIPGLAMRILLVAQLSWPFALAYGLLTQPGRGELAA